MFFVSQENDYFAVDMEVCLSSDTVNLMQLHGKYISALYIIASVYMNFMSTDVAVSCCGLISTFLSLTFYVNLTYDLA